MRWLAVLLGVALTVPAWGAGETLYVRPADAEYGAENGTSYATAYDGFGDVTWAGTDTAGAVDPGDTLLVCGTFGASSADGGAATMLTVSQAGTSLSALVTIDGDCSSQGDLAKAVINPNYATSILRGIHTPGATGIYHSIKNIELRNFDGSTISRPLSLGTANTESGDAKYITVDNVDVYSTRATTLADAENGKCIWGAGSDITIKNGIIEGCADDGIWIVGARAIVENMDIADVSRETTGGDCAQLTGATTGPSTGSSVILSDCDHSAKDSKQCWVFGTASDDPVRYAYGNTCLLPIGATVANGILFDSGTGYAWRNFIRGGNVGVRGNAGDRMDFIGNIVMDTSWKGAYVTGGVTAANLDHNTLIRIGDGLQEDTAAVSTTVDSAEHKLRNNIVLGSTGAGIDRQSANVIEGNNLIFDAVTPTSVFCRSVTCEAESVAPDATDILADPQFVGGDNPTTVADVRLTTSSPACAAGTYIAGARDFDDLPMGYPADIGAFRCPKPGQSVDLGDWSTLFSGLMMGLAVLMGGSMLFRPWRVA